MRPEAGMNGPDGQLLYGVFGDRDRQYRVASSGTPDTIRVYATWRGSPTMIAVIDGASGESPAAAFAGGWSNFEEEWRAIVTREACRVYREALQRGARVCSG